MKPFDLEEAKAGKPVCTRDGFEVKILSFDIKHKAFPICGIVRFGDGEDDELVRTWTRGGGYEDDGRERDGDLMMASEKHEGWVLIHTEDLTTENVYESEEEAEKEKSLDCGNITTVHIEWEE